MGSGLAKGYLPSHRYLNEGCTSKMNEASSEMTSGSRILSSLLGGINLIVLVPMGYETQAHGVGFWEFLFVLIGVYYAYTGVRHIISAHDRLAWFDPSQGRVQFPQKGIFASIRYPVGAGFMRINIATVLLFRSFAVIPVALVFGALWFMLAKIQDDSRIERYGTDYVEYMRRTGMFRGKGEQGLRLQDSGYGMY